MWDPFHHSSPRLADSPLDARFPDKNRTPDQKFKLKAAQACSMAVVGDEIVIAADRELLILLRSSNAIACFRLGDD